MKYHLKNQNGNAICGAVADRPDTFLFNVDGFKAHYSKEHQCKKCAAILAKKEQPTKVILELYMEIWYCYEDGKSMATPLFTTTSYEAAEHTCKKRHYKVIQIIDLELQDFEN